MLRQTLRDYQFDGIDLDIEDATSPQAIWKIVGDLSVIHKAKGVVRIRLEDLPKFSETQNDEEDGSDHTSISQLCSNYYSNYRKIACSTSR